MGPIKTWAYWSCVAGGTGVEVEFLEFFFQAEIFGSLGIKPGIKRFCVGLAVNGNFTRFLLF